MKRVICLAVVAALMGCSTDLRSVRIGDRVDSATWLAENAEGLGLSQYVPVLVATSTGPPTLHHAEVVCERNREEQFPEGDCSYLRYYTVRGDNGDLAVAKLCAAVPERSQCKGDVVTVVGDVEVRATEVIGIGIDELTDIDVVEAPWSALVPFQF